MLVLPPTSPGSPHLPLNDTSAGEIVALLLEEDIEPVAWCDLLTADPIFLLWVASQHAHGSNVEPESIAALSQWLTPKALNLLDWSNRAPRLSEPPEGSTWREIVSVALARGWSARDEANPAADDGAFMRSLLLATVDSMRDAGITLPSNSLGGWLSRCCKQAAGSEKTDNSHSLDDSDVKRHLRRWPARDSGGLHPLPGLTDRLRRLRDLELDHEQTLLREKLASMRELAYGASHEINNPLANISTRAQTLLRDEQDPERRRMLATIHLQSIRAHEMIANLMHFAKPPTLDRQPVDLAETLASVVDELAEWSSSQGTAIETAFPEETCKVEADPGQLTVALRALIRNSLEALAAGGKIEVELAHRPVGADSPVGVPLVVIRVRDNGPGIAAAALPHIFDPFYSGREAGRGLGFGLAWCWRIIERHGGRIEVDSEEGHGAEFRIVLSQYVESATVPLTAEREPLSE